MLYQDFWVDCDECEVDSEHFPTIMEMVRTLHDYGWSISEDAYQAVCEDCRHAILSQR